MKDSPDRADYQRDYFEFIWGDISVDVKVSPEGIELGYCRRLYDDDEWGGGGFITWEELERLRSEARKAANV